MPDLPPLWYSRFERFLLKNKGLILLTIYVLIFFVWPFFAGPEHLDHELLVGLPTD